MLAASEKFQSTFTEALLTAAAGLASCSSAMATASANGSMGMLETASTAVMNSASGRRAQLENIVYLRIL